VQLNSITILAPTGVGRNMCDVGHISSLLLSGLICVRPSSSALVVLGTIDLCQILSFISLFIGSNPTLLDSIASCWIIWQD